MMRALKGRSKRKNNENQLFYDTDYGAVNMDDATVPVPASPIDASFDDEIIWGSNPNHNYSAYFLRKERNLRGRTDDSTLEDVLGSNGRIQLDSQWKQMAESKTSSSLIDQSLGTPSCTGPSGDTGISGLTGPSDEIQALIDFKEAPENDPCLQLGYPVTPERSPPEYAIYPIEAPGTPARDADVPSIVFIGDSPKRIIRLADVDNVNFIERTTISTAPRYSRKTVRCLILLLILMVLIFTGALLMIVLRAIGSSGKSQQGQLASGESGLPTAEPSTTKFPAPSMPPGPTLSLLPNYISTSPPTQTPSAAVEGPSIEDGGVESPSPNTDEETISFPSIPFPSKRPTGPPTLSPVNFPSEASTPQTYWPAATPRPTRSPTDPPLSYQTKAPTPQEGKAEPTPRPTDSPGEPSSLNATRSPTSQPSPSPTPVPTPWPTPRPTTKQTPRPTRPMETSTAQPATPGPTPDPTRKPTPTPDPTRKPTPTPTPRPTEYPTYYPIPLPTFSTTTEPTIPPTKETNHGPPTSTENHTPPLNEDLVQFFEELSDDSGEALKDPTTPQYKALAWLSEDPRLFTYTGVKKMQRFVLATLFFSLSGPYWKKRDGWLSDLDECLWFSGSKRPCDNFGILRDLELNGNGLDGTLPVELSWLHGLTEIQFQDNSIHGTLPPQLGNLANLKRLQLTRNSLTGTLPSEWETMSNMETMGVGRNLLTGTLPQEYGALTAMTTWGLERNDFSGTIPSSYGFLSGLKKLSLDDNSLSGTLPDSFSFLTKLDSLALNTNQLIGYLPYGFCELAAARKKGLKLIADCEEIACPCCTECCSDDNGCTNIKG